VAFAPSRCHEPMTNADSQEPTEDSWPAAFGERLRLARERAGMSQETVQQELGYPTRSLTRWENGRSDPGFAKVVRMTELYGVSMDWVGGRTSIEQCIKPGMVMIDNAVLDVLSRLTEAGKTLRDVPHALLRTPGINYAAVVPAAPLVVAKSAATLVESRMRSLWKQLGGESL
jgi:transcriptional regulator with XRE-family HTH domain